MTRSHRRDGQITDDWLQYTCRIDLSGEAEEDGVIVQYPGEMILADVHVEFADEAELAACRAQLRFVAHGSGSPETHAFAQRTLLANTTVKPGQTFATHLSMHLPGTAPMSYEGVYVKIGWRVAIEFIAVDGRLRVEEVPMVVRPRPVDYESGMSRASVSTIMSLGMVDVRALAGAAKRADDVELIDAPTGETHDPGARPDVDVVPEADERRGDVRSFYGAEDALKDLSFRVADAAPGERAQVSARRLRRLAQSATATAAHSDDDEVRISLRKASSSGVQQVIATGYGPTPEDAGHDDDAGSEAAPDSSEPPDRT